ncbi:MAG: hypothetical protein AAF389_14970 [Gemmatimonadota bacterium]
MVQTIEKTGKKWKGMKLWGVFIMLGGAVLVATQNGTLSMIGIALALLGIGVIAYANIGAWWNHG